MGDHYDEFREQDYQRQKSKKPVSGCVLQGLRFILDITLT